MTVPLDAVAPPVGISREYSLQSAWLWLISLIVKFFRIACYFMSSVHQSDNVLYISLMSHSILDTTIDIEA